MTRNWAPIASGAVMVAIVTGCLFVAQVFLPMDDIRVYLYRNYDVWFDGNPLAQLRLFGAVPGGLLAGYLA